MNISLKVPKSPYTYNINKVYFYGSFPPKNNSAYGGGEEGNLRTVNLLRSAGFQVKIIRKRRTPSSASKLYKLCSYPFRMLEGVIKLFFILLFGDRNAIVHISGFCGHTILNEYILMKISKLLGYYTIFELRGGGANKFYYSASASYKRMFRYIVSRADYVFSQGMENKPLIESISKAPFFYYPNYVLDDFLPLTLMGKPNDKINLIFFGRVEKEKNVLMIVDIAALLQKKYDNVSLTILGNGKTEYVNEVIQRMSKMLIEGTYSYIKGCKHDDLKNYLQDKHFYIFPSQQEYEGHSNAVTEAMAYGIVPIVSPQGFSPTIVGRNDLVVDDYDPEQYASCINRIIANEKFDEYSANVYERVKGNYVDNIVGKRLINIYGQLLNSNHNV